MNRLLIVALAAVSVTAAANAATPVAPLKGHELSAQAKITRPGQANRPSSPSGKIADQEQENESGGSGLRYSFDVRSMARSSRSGSMR